jgi:RNA polymerase sigma-70 factor (ECF subfamily)
MMARVSDFDAAFERVLEAAQAGAGWAYTHLYESLAPAVAGYLRAQGVEDPEDLTSEVFIKVFTGCRSFAGDEAQFRSWVFTVAHCRVVDARRAKARTEEVQTFGPGNLDDGQGPTAPAAEDEALGRLATERAAEVLRDLSPDQRDVLALRLICQMSVQEVAAVLDKPPGAIKALQRRALASLRRKFGVPARPPRRGGVTLGGY